MKTICLILGIIILMWIPGVDAKDFKFPEITGWKQSGEVQTFIPKTLFEYINGAADLYIMYDFQELKVAEYLNEKKASVIVDVYRHKTPTHAFGIYSQERLSDANFINIGAQGYVEKNVLNFLTGLYYVKLNSFNTGAEDEEILLNFAKRCLKIWERKEDFHQFYLPSQKKGKRRIPKNLLIKTFWVIRFYILLLLRITSFPGRNLNSLS